MKPALIAEESLPDKASILGVTFLEPFLTGLAGIQRAKTPAKFEQRTQQELAAHRQKDRRSASKRGEYSESWPDGVLVSMAPFFYCTGL